MKVDVILHSLMVTVHSSYFRTTDVTGACELPEGVEMVMPGDNVKMVVTSDCTNCNGRWLRFAIREGGRTVGAGCCKILENYLARSSNRDSSKISSKKVQESE